MVLIGLLLIAFALGAGCTVLQAPPPATATPATPAVTAPASCPPAPGSFQQLPDYESVSITVDRNTISEDPTITTIFNGGKGLGMVRTMTVTLYRSDCTTDTQTRKDPGIGTSITQMGTTGTDRIKVDLLMTSGDQFTVIDQLYPFAPKI